MSVCCSECERPLVVITDVKRIRVTAFTMLDEEKSAKKEWLWYFSQSEVRMWEPSDAIERLKNGEKTVELTQSETNWTGVSYTRRAILSMRDDMDCYPVEQVYHKEAQEVTVKPAFAAVAHLLASGNVVDTADLFNDGALDYMGKLISLGKMDDLQASYLGFSDIKWKDETNGTVHIRLLVNGPAGRPLPLMVCNLAAVEFARELTSGTKDRAAKAARTDE